MSLDTIRDRLGANAHPIQLPIGEENGFIGVVDLLTKTATTYTEEMGKEPQKVEIPAPMVTKVEEYRAKLVEAIAEQNDDLLEKYLNGQELTLEELKKGLRAAVLEV